MSGPPPRASWPVRVVGVLGELLITAGVLVLLFLVWQLWWTDVVAGRAQAQEVTRIERSFAAPTPTPTDDRVHLAAPTGEAFALIRVPRFGSGWVRPVIEGTTADILAQGVGHYPGTALPGAVGNFAVAGHRTTYGAPFNRIDTLRTGDRVVIETATAYDVYVVRSHEVVRPTQVDVVAPVPDRPGAVPTGRWLTMTSCHPKFSAAHRWVVHAELDQTYPRAGGLPAAVLTLGGA